MTQPYSLPKPLQMEGMFNTVLKAENCKILPFLPCAEKAEEVGRIFS